jgi:hypothetical protein
MNNHFKFSLLLCLTSILLLFSNGVTSSNISVVENPHQKETTFHKNSLHQTAFIQPQAGFSICSNRVDSFYPAKINRNFEFTIVKTGQVSGITKPAFSQDVNRCESVSLLLFPYHIFW